MNCSKTSIKSLYSVMYNQLKVVQICPQLVCYTIRIIFLPNVFGVGVSCRNLYSFVVYLYVRVSGSITSVGEERANLSAVIYL